jgi:SAM-dependent methyltransferase
MTTEPTVDWREVNRANWDERVAIHLASEAYDLGPLRAGRGRLHPIEEAELGPVAGQRILHLQCHFGRDTLILAQQGATVVGLDFSGPAVEAATALAAELGLAARARFVQSDLYAAREAIPEPASFDRVFVTWGAIGWLPDIQGWAAIVAHFLRPGGRLYLAESHPTAQIFDDLVPEADGRPGWFAPYFEDGPLDLDDPSDYADGEAQLTNSRTFWWMHRLGDVVSALVASGLALSWLHEHDRVPWRMFKGLVEAPGGMYRWPDKPWLPLAFSLEAVKR